MRRALFAALVAAQVGSSRVPARSQVRATQGILALFFATSLASARSHRGHAVAVGVSTAAEVVGVATGKPFGPYTYGPHLGPRVAGVPVVVGIPWATMAQPAWAAAGRLTRRRALRVPLAAWALTAWDVFLDPRMAADGYWHWPDGGRYEGVPLSNFAGWLLVGLLVFPFFADDEDEGVDLYVWTWVGETFANAVLWRRPRVALAGTLAMGSVAVPVLRTSPKPRLGRPASRKRRAGR